MLSICTSLTIRPDFRLNCINFVVQYVIRVVHVLPKQGRPLSSCYLQNVAWLIKKSAGLPADRLSHGEMFLSSLSTQFMLLKDY